MNVLVARIYISEAQHTRKKIVEKLHHEKVKGVTVFRGISGFGDSGEVHGSGLVDISLDLPLVIEFFDSAERVRSIIDHLDDLVKPHHVIIFAAEITEPS